jgi:carboxyl-terminal processing protease
MINSYFQIPLVSDAITLDLKRKMKRVLFYSISLFICLIIAFLAGNLTHGEISINQDGHFQVLNQAYNLLITHGLLETPDDRHLEYGMIRGMLQVYDDPYSIFVEPAQHELETNSLEGDFGGIGVDLQKGMDGKLFLFPFPNSPAEKADILDGDQLFAVDDLVIEPSTPIDSILAAIRGNEGEPVSLTIGRAPDFKPIKRKVIREIFPLPSITSRIYSQENRLGIIKVNLIAASTPEEISLAFKDLRKQGATNFILDLRDNSGGLLSAGIDTAEMFLSKGTILQQQYKGKEVETISVESPGVLADVPLVVLINHSTASAAEIIAGALKQNHRAWLIGEPSYGKDKVQLVFDLEDGSSLHITTLKWVLPDGQWLNPDNVIDPNEKVEYNDEDFKNGRDPQMDRALEYLNSKI